MDRQPVIEIETPRSAFRLVGATFRLYRRLPLLFVTLAAGVVIPYWLIVLAVTGHGPYTDRGLGLTAGLILVVTQSTLVGPLVSALHVHAVDDLNRGRSPTIGSVASRGLKTLPVVSAAVIAAAIGADLGFVALIIPGFILLIRWSVVAQSAALEDGGWIDALKRSWQLTRENFLHVLGTLLLAGILVGIVNFALVRAFRFQSTSVHSFLIGLAFEVLSSSFAALATALLYFDLRSRLRPVGDPTVGPGSPVTDADDRPPVEPTGHPLDPDSYSDEDRPPGWYVVPEKPWRMRYWPGDGGDGWSKRTAKTPKQTQQGWWKISDR